jgi:hypothetical protein
VAHVLVRHRMLIFVAKILWSTTHAPQNAYFGAPQKRFSLLVIRIHRYNLWSFKLIYKISAVLISISGLRAMHIYDQPMLDEDFLHVFQCAYPFLDGGREVS